MKSMNKTRYARGHQGLTIRIAVVMSFLCFAIFRVDASDSLQSRSLEQFSHIKVGGLVNVRLSRGDKPEARIQAKGIGLNDIITEVKNDTLLVTTKGRHRGEEIAIDVSYTSLESITTSGAATVKSKDKISGKKLLVNITDAGDAVLEVDVDQLEIVMRDNGNAVVSGNATIQEVRSFGGGGRLDNSDLVSGQNL